MGNIQRAIFGGVLGGILMLVLFANLAAKPALASSREPQPAAAENTAPNPGADQASAPQDCPLGANFPDAVRRWCGLIERYAAESGLDPNFIAAVMLQESGGNPDALSRSGAVGLLQVMPRDGKAAAFQCVNGPCFAARPSMAELYDPEFNLRYATAMLADLAQRHGDLRQALFAYGPADAGYSYADKVLAIYAASGE